MKQHSLFLLAAVALAALVPCQTSVAQDATGATIVVHVPADARVFFDDGATRQSGPMRTFLTAALPAGRKFSYRIKAEVVRDGKVVSQSQDVTVWAGHTTEVDLGSLGDAHVYL